MTAPTARELLSGIGAHQRFIDALEVRTEEDSLVFNLAARVEAVLALKRHPGTTETGDWADAEGDGWNACLEKIMRLLDGGQP